MPWYAWAAVAVGGLLMFTLPSRTQVRRAKSLVKRCARYKSNEAFDACVDRELSR